MRFYRFIAPALIAVLAGGATAEAARTIRVPGVGPVPIGHPTSLGREGRQTRDHQIRAMVGDIQAQHAAGPKAGRGFHHGVIADLKARVELHYDQLVPELKEVLAGGIFDPRSQSADRPAIVRVSHGRSDKGDAQGRRDERKPDVRGLAVLFETNNEAQALTTTNQPAQAFPTGLEFLTFFKELGAPHGSKLAALRQVVREIGLGTTVRALGKLAVGAMPIADALQTQYWTPAPIAVGRTADGQTVYGTYTFVPAQGRYLGRSKLRRVATGLAHLKPFNAEPNYLRDGVEQRLSGEGDARFDVKLQLFVDEKHTPINRMDRAWDRKRAPELTVASLVIPRQQLDAAFERRVEAEGSFGPQVRAKGLPVEAELVGTPSLDRETAYDASAAGRGASTGGDLVGLVRSAR